jgi:hypothetical protein
MPTLKPVAPLEQELIAVKEEMARYLKELNL